MDTSWIDVVAGEIQIARESDIEEIARHISAEPAVIDDFVDLVRAVCGVEDRINEFGLRVGDWQIDLSTLAMRAALTSALVATLMDVDGLVKTGVAALALVLPSIVEIERVELSPSDEMLLAEVRLTHAAGRGFVTVETLYNELPHEARGEINLYDFADMVERIRAVGYIEGGVIDDHILVIDEDKRRRVSFSD